MEFLFEILFEVLLQILFQIATEIGFYCLRDTFEKSKIPLSSTIGFFLWGLLAGAISIWPFPHSFIGNPNIRLLNLFITPLAAAGLMFLIGKYKERKSISPIALDKFGYAFAFALAMTLVRWKLTK